MTMLREICRVADDEDAFVGLRFIDGRPEVALPIGYSVANSDKDVRQDILHLLSAIQYFSSRREGNRNSTAEGTVLEFPIQSYQYVIYDFLQNGYYTEREVKYIESQRGKINWKRTIQTEQPHLDDDNVVYLDFVVKTNKISNDNLLTRIHEYCVYESFLKIGWLYVEGNHLPSKPGLTLNKNLFLSTLSKELGQTFSDNKKRLLKSMINIINEAAEETSNNSVVSFGVHRFEYIWEAMIDYVFGENNREQYYPRAHWHIVSRNGLRIESSELRPDTIMKYDGKIFILDAKYYKYGITGIPAHLPNTDSIQKQITYGDYVAERGFAPRNDIYNAFLMPFCKGDEDYPYKFVCVGIADWRSYTTETENYNYVLGILIDTKHLITSYSKHNAGEIERLSLCIEASLYHYKNSF